jgi:hypothetical protein
MTWPQMAIGYAGLLLLAGVLCGMLARGRVRSSLAFTAYVLFVLLTDSAIGLWRDTFYNRHFWLFRETGVAVLRLAVALDLAHRTFRGFPGAAATVRRVVFLLLAVTCVGVIAMPPEDPTYHSLVDETVPRIANGTVWLLTAISALVLWYRLPLAPFHRAILLGITPYLVVVTATRAVLRSSDWRLRDEMGYLETVAFLLVEAFWCRAAWQASDDRVRPRHMARVPMPVAPAHS